MSAQLHAAGGVARTCASAQEGHNGDMHSTAESIYRSHHKKSRGGGYVLLGEMRSAFLRKYIGTEKRVIDIGCRDGALTDLYRADNEVLGVDVDTESLERAHAKGIETHHLDLNGEWDLPLGAFDVVVAAEVLEHLYYPELVIRKMSALLKGEGICLITVPNAFSFRNRLRYMLGQKRGTPLSDPTHINHFTVNELCMLLLDRFKEVEVYGIGRYSRLARWFPQAFAFDLCFMAARPNKV